MRILIRRNIRGSILVGVLVLVTVTVALIGLWTIASAAKKIKPRQLPPEETNSFYHYFRPEIIYASPPQQADPNAPSAIKFKAAAEPVYGYHTNEVKFVDSECLEDAWVFIERTQDFVNWTVLRWGVLFDEPTYTNGMVYLRFVDSYAPPGLSIYRGLVITNQ